MIVRNSQKWGVCKLQSMKSGKKAIGSAMSASVFCTKEHGERKAGVVGVR